MANYCKVVNRNTGCSRYTLANLKHSTSWSFRLLGPIRLRCQLRKARASCSEVISSRCSIAYFRGPGFQKWRATGAPFSLRVPQLSTQILAIRLHSFIVAFREASLSQGLGLWDSAAGFGLSSSGPTMISGSLCRFHASSKIFTHAPACRPAKESASNPSMKGLASSCPRRPCEGARMAAF